MGQIRARDAFQPREIVVQLTVVQPKQLERIADRALFDTLRRLVVPDPPENRQRNSKKRDDEKQPFAFD